MSAFMCSDNHLAFLVYAFKRYCAPPGSGITMFSHELAEIGRVLKAENARSVAVRYAHDAKPCPSCGEIVCDPRIGYDPARDPRNDPQGRGIPAPCPFAVVPLPAADQIEASTGCAITPVAAIKLAQCYQYQANEHDGWEGSRAKDITDRLIGAAIGKLPGYESAPWGLP